MTHEKMEGVILAAGEGTRLRPLTSDKPKGLVEVAGKPLLDYCLDSLGSLGVDRAVLVVGYEGEKIVESYGKSFRDIRLDYVWQHEPQGLAHALLQAEPELDDATFAVMNGDNVFGGSIDRIPDSVSRDADATLVVEEATTSEARKTGVCVTDEDGSLVSVVEKPDNPPSNLVCTGLFFFKPSVFELCRTVPRSERGEYEITDAVDRMIDEGMDVRKIEYDGWRLNINTRDDIEVAEDRLNG